MEQSILYAASWMLSPHAPPVAGGALLVRNGLIVAVGTLDELKRSHSAPVVDYPGCAIIPGFVNAHTHLELTHFPSWKIRNNMNYHPRRFVDWIIQLIKVKRGVAAEDYSHSVNEGIRMCLEVGTTAIGEIVTETGLVSLYGSSNLSGRLYPELLGHDPVRFTPLLEHAMKIGDTDGPGSFLTGVSPHSVYTLGEENMAAIRDVAVGKGMPLTIHVAESAAETDFVFDSSGPIAGELYPYVGWEQYLLPPRHATAVGVLDRAGLLTASSLAVHCVHVTRADAEILRQRDVGIVLCPRSNERLDVGRAPVALFRKLGIPLALGTDSLASNDSLSLWDEMRFALDAFPGELSPADLFRMVTANAAATIGIAPSHGSLEPGKRADFQIVENIGVATTTPRVLEQVITGGVTRETYVAGERYAAWPGDL